MSSENAIYLFLVIYIDHNSHISSIYILAYNSAMILFSVENTLHSDIVADE